MDYPSPEVIRAVYNLNDLIYTDRVTVESEKRKKNSVEIFGFKA